MKKLLTIFLLPCLLFFLSSCKKKGVGLEIDFHDPQEIPTINHFFEDADAWELIKHFGEENIYFGNTPPNLNDISFLVNGMKYEYTERYSFDLDADDPLHADFIPITTSPPTYDASKEYHHFFDQDESRIWHKIKTQDSQGNDFVRKYKYYVIGHDSLFTAYYKETITDEGSGRPTCAIIFSGIVRLDKNGQFAGISNFRYGKQFISYEKLPAIANYAPGTIFIKTHDALCIPLTWDTIPDKNNREFLIP